MEKIDLSIIIVDYKSKMLLFECLRSVKEKLSNISYEIIIVDNNQEEKNKIVTNELEDLISAPYFLIPAENNGFGTSNNLGAMRAKGEYLLLLNPDTIITDNSIEKMLDFMRNHREIGAITPFLYQKDGRTLQKYFFGKFQSLAGLTIRRYNIQKVNFSEEFFYSDIVTGAALMIRKDNFDKIGGFDENIFMYLEDDDLCKRLVNLGLKNAVLCTAKIIHLEGKSSNNREKKKYYYRSQDYYWQKHNGLFATTLMKIIRWPMKAFKTK